MTIVATALTPRTCDAYALVLEAVGVRFALLRDGVGYVFWVDDTDAARARDALARYLEENAPRPTEPPRKLAGSGLAAAAAYVGVELFVAIAAGMSLLNAAWFDAGALDGASLRAGDWWRPITALTLHADLLHLGSNLAFGVLCLGLVARVYGSGVGLLLTLAAAVAGNALEGFFMAHGHESLGASGAVFAALGILGSVHWPTRTARGRWYLRGSTLVGALVLLALLGTGDARTDIEAHALGFGFGLLAGLPLRRAGVAPHRVQQLCGTVAAAALGIAWTAAILHNR
jgi:membrane associated rhomboid family serine protease